MFYKIEKIILGRRWYVWWIIKNPTTALAEGELDHRNRITDWWKRIKQQWTTNWQWSLDIGHWIAHR
jgi:hypothetical protein